MWSSSISTSRRGLCLLPLHWPELCFQVCFVVGLHLPSTPANMGSHPTVISDTWPRKSCSAACLAPSLTPHLPCIYHLDDILIGKWRVITNLSFPHCRSMNDAIDPNLCSLTYSMVDKVIHLIAGLPCLPR